MNELLSSVKSAVTLLLQVDRDSVSVVVRKGGTGSPMLEMILYHYIIIITYFIAVTTTSSNSQGRDVNKN